MNWHLYYTASFSLRQVHGSQCTKEYYTREQKIIKWTVCTQWVRLKITTRSIQRNHKRHARPSLGQSCIGRLLVALYAACCYFWTHSLRADCSFNYFLPYTCKYSWRTLADVCMVKWGTTGSPSLMCTTVNTPQWPCMCPPGKQWQSTFDCPLPWCTSRALGCRALQ